MVTLETEPCCPYCFIYIFCPCLSHFGNYFFGGRVDDLEAIARRRIAPLVGYKEIGLH
jgi:hypothetical protein